MIFGLLFAAPYHFKPLGFIPYDLNDEGVIVGSTRRYASGGAIDSPVMLSNGKMVSLGNYPGGGIAKTINRHGDILIFTENTRGPQPKHHARGRDGYSGCYFWSKGKPKFIGNFDLIGRLTGNDEFLGRVDLSESRIKISNGKVSGSPIPTIPPKSVIPNSRSRSLTYDMNEDAAMVGTTDFGTSWEHAYKMDRHGNVTDLHPSVDMHTGWQAEFINSRGHILGYHSYDSSIGGGALFLWRDGKCADVSSDPPGGLPLHANSFNDRDQVVGSRTLNENGSTNHRLANGELTPPFPAYATNHAVIWIEGKAVDLNDIADAPKDCVLESATKVNNKGWIIGTCVQNHKRFGFLLKPQG